MQMANVKICKCENMQMCKYANVQIDEARLIAVVSPKLLKAG